MTDDLAHEDVRNNTARASPCPPDDPSGRLYAGDCVLENEPRAFHLWSAISRAGNEYFPCCVTDRDVPPPERPARGADYAGCVFWNQNKQRSSQPDYRGTFMGGGLVYNVSIWLKADNDISVSFQPSETVQAKRFPRAGEAAVSTPYSEPAPEDATDAPPPTPAGAIPF